MSRSPVSEPMSSQELWAIVRELPEWPSEFTRAWERMKTESPNRKARATYRSEREHLTRWLSEYDGPGYYQRQQSSRDAKFFYNHFNDAYGLGWLAEAVGVDRETVREGFAAIAAAPESPSSQAGAFRRVIPWALVEERLRGLTTRTAPDRRNPRRQHRRPRWAGRRGIG